LKKKIFTSTKKNIKINTTLTQNQYEVERVKNFVSDNEKEIESFHNKISNIEELDTQVKFLEGSLISKEKNLNKELQKTRDLENKIENYTQAKAKSIQLEEIEANNQLLKHQNDKLKKISLRKRIYIHCISRRKK